VNTLGFVTLIVFPLGAFVVAFIVSDKRRAKERAAYLAENPEPYIIRACRTVADCESYCCRMSRAYDLVSIADTDSYITIALRRKRF
jgi:hypothetical protein